MATKSKKAEPDVAIAAADQFIFVEVPAPSNDNVHGHALGLDNSLESGDGLGMISADVMFTVGDYIYEGDDADLSSALTVALDGAEADAGEYAAFSSSVMFVFGDMAAEA